MLPVRELAKLGWITWWNQVDAGLLNYFIRQYRSTISFDFIQQFPLLRLLSTISVGYFDSIGLPNTLIRPVITFRIEFQFAEQLNTRIKLRFTFHDHWDPLKVFLFTATISRPNEPNWMNSLLFRGGFGSRFAIDELSTHKHRLAVCVNDSEAGKVRNSGSIALRLVYWLTIDPRLAD